MPHVSPFDLPDSLLLGVATAATQIEGGDRNNSWYDFAQRPGVIADGSSPLRATEHWQRWREDTDLMADLGVQTYRMSVEWARIEPRPGAYDHAVLDRYREEIGAIRDRGIVPLVTLHHFTNPRWFEERGGWTSEESAEVFSHFTRVTVPALSDLVDDWCTINEPNVYAVQGYLFGEFPPGQKSWTGLRAVLRNMARAHVRTYQLIHELKPDAQVCFAHHVRGFDPLNAMNPLHQVLARTNKHLFNDVIAKAMLTGHFGPLLGRADVDPGHYYDVLAINYYSRTATKGLADHTFPDSPINDLGWEIHPHGLVDLARDLHEEYDAPIWVTENGTCDNQERFRSRFIAEHVQAMVRSGLPFERYYHWCLVDNWEWAEGEAARFGIVGLDYDTQTRAVKPSGELFRALASERRLSAEMLDRFVTGQEYPRS